MRSCRVAIHGCSVDERSLDLGWSQLFLVVRDDATGPGPNDWEASLTTPEGQRLEPGEHVLRLRLADEHVVSGRALLRFSDGRRHLFRGDGALAGADLVLDAAADP
jgi:hypothetical protein